MTQQKNGTTATQQWHNTRETVKISRMIFNLTVIEKGGGVSREIHHKSYRRKKLEGHFFLFSMALGRCQVDKQKEIDIDFHDHG